MTVEAKTRRRPSRTPLLQNGFRPFFLGGASWAALALALWLASLAGAPAPPSAFTPLAWHQHEMLFGYVGAVVSGFLLTAVPNWTGRLPVQGRPLAGLIAIWLLARLAVATGGLIGAPLALVLDGGFYVLLLGVALREVWAGRNWRNLPVCAVLGAFTLANVLSHLEPVAGWSSGDLGRRLALASIVFLISLVGGRIVPSFTRNWLAKRAAPALPRPFGRFDQATIGLLLLALVTWLAWGGPVSGGLLLAAALAHGVRLAGWCGLATLAEPLVVVLHLGYAWLVVGLALAGLAELDVAPNGSAAVHALTTGAIGTMTLAVMTRATLGHTGHPLHAGPGTVLIYGLVTAGALLRVAWSLLPDQGLALLELSGLLWGGAFATFAALYGPLLAGPRVAAGDGT